MNDAHQSKAQLLAEVAELRQQIKELQTSPPERAQVAEPLAPPPSSARSALNALAATLTILDEHGMILAVNAICQQIIESHHGSMALDSTPGEGTTVTIDLLQADPPQPRITANRKEAAMPTYVTLFNYSAEGFKELDEERRQQHMQLIESQGGRVIGAYGLMGKWDVLLITEFPDEKSAIRALVSTCQSGIGTTQTMTALPLAEFVQLGQNP